jgi:hypothetical protein
VDIFEQGVEVVAALEKNKGAKGFEDDEGGNDGQGEKHAQAGFNGFFHRF